MGAKILDGIVADIKCAMKAKDKERLITLRTLHADIKNVGINMRKEVTDEDVASVVAKGIKMRLDAVEQFEKAGRKDLADKDLAQIEIYKTYQPKQLDRVDVEEMVKRIVAETGASSKKDMGRVMKALMPLVKGKADGKMVSQIVNESLS